MHAHAKRDRDRGGARDRERGGRGAEPGHRSDAAVDRGRAVRERGQHHGEQPCEAQSERADLEIRNAGTANLTIAVPETHQVVVASITPSATIAPGGTAHVNLQITQPSAECQTPVSQLRLTSNDPSLKEA